MKRIALIGAFVLPPFLVGSRGTFCNPDGLCLHQVPAAVGKTSDIEDGVTV